MFRSSFTRLRGSKGAHACARTMSFTLDRQESAAEKVERFLANTRRMSIDPRIVLQKVPGLLIELANDESKDSGPVANKLLQEIADDRLNFTAKIYALAIEAWIRSLHKDSVEEAIFLLEDLLTRKDIIESKDDEEINSINSAFAMVIHGLLDQYGHLGEAHGNSIHRRSEALIQKASALEERIVSLYDDTSLPLYSNTTAINARIALMGAKGEVDKALALFNQMIDAEDCGSYFMAPNKVSYNTVVHACAKLGRHQDASSMLRLMLSRKKQQLSKVQPDLISFNTLLNAYSNSGTSDAGRSAERILDWMEQLATTEGYDIRPDVYSYTSVIDAYSKSASPERAEAVLHRLLKRREEGQNISPSVVTFTAVLDAIARSKRRDAPSRAVAIMSLMKELHSTKVADLEPTTTTYNALMNIWNKNRNHPGAVEECVRILGLMKQSPKGARPNNRSYSIMLSVLASQKGDILADAEYFLREMEQSADPDVQPNTITYNTFLNCLANSKVQSAGYRAQEIFLKMKENEAKGYLKAAPMAETYNVMMKIVAKTFRYGGAERAEKLLDEMESLYEAGNDRMRPTVISYTTCISAWSREHDEEKIVRAQNLMDRMKEANRSGNYSAKPTTTTYNAMLSCYKNAILNRGVSPIDQPAVVAQLMNLLNDLRHSADTRPTQITYITILTALGNLPNQNDQNRAVIKNVVGLCEEDKQMSEQIVQLVKRIAPGLFY